MKNLMKATGIAILLSGVFAVTNVSAQTTPASQSTTKTSTQTTTPGQATPTTTTTTKSTSTSTKTITDKVLGKDSKGNVVYKGTKGNYYIQNGKHVTETETKFTKVTTPATK